MKLKIYIEITQMMLSTISKPSKVKTSIACIYILVLGITSNSAIAGRFDPPSLKLQLQDFDSRIEGNIFNVDFLLAHLLNNSRKTVREVGEITDTVENLLQNTTVFTNETSNSGVSAGSVILPPGTTADTIIILNQNEGDSIAIQR